MKVKIGDWNVSISKRENNIHVKNVDTNKTSRVTFERFDQQGMNAFPKDLCELIKRSLRHARLYDKFMDKYFEYTDET